jgi:hypothetical protein
VGFQVAGRRDQEAVAVACRDERAIKVKNGLLHACDRVREAFA